MNSNKKLKKLAIIGLLSVGVLSACGGNNDDKETNDNNKQNEVIEEDIDKNENDKNINDENITDEIDTEEDIANKGNVDDETNNESNNETNNEEDKKDKEEKLTKSGNKNNETGGTNVEKYAFENQKFRIKNVDIKNNGTNVSISGVANVSGSEVKYSVEDGHDILAEGTVKVAAGNENWRPFELPVTVDPSRMHNPSSYTILIYELNQTSNQWENTLSIPIQLTQ